MRKKTPAPLTSPTKGRGVVTTPPPRTSDNDPFIRRLRDLWDAARNLNQNETATTVQDLLTAYKKQPNRRARRAFQTRAEKSLQILERPYFDEIEAQLDAED